jgi:DNA-binding SARP family transcriptional activator
MDHEYKSLELAKAYEHQGYYQDALDMYDSLNETYQGTDQDIQAGCTRMKKILEKAGPSVSYSSGQEHKTDENQMKGRLAKKMEEWLRLLILTKRLGMFKRIQARF